MATPCLSYDNVIIYEQTLEIRCTNALNKFVEQQNWMNVSKCMNVFCCKS